MKKIPLVGALLFAASLGFAVSYDSGSGGGTGTADGTGNWTALGTTSSTITGAVGIGTTAPVSLLDITLPFGNPTSYSIKGISINAENDDSPQIVLRSTASQGGIAFTYYGLQNIASTSGWGTIAMQSANDHGFVFNAINTGVAITTSNQMGIGTSAPAYTLDVQGNIRSTGTLTVNSIDIAGSSDAFGLIKTTQTLEKMEVNGSTWTFGTSSVTWSTDGNKWKVIDATNTLTVSISTDPTNGFTSRSETFIQVPSWETWTITKVYATSLPSGATVQFNLEERTAAGLGSAGTAVFTVSNATATVGGVNDLTGITSFANASIAGGNYLVATTPATLAAAGGPNRLVFTIWYLKQ